MKRELSHYEKAIRLRSFGIVSNLRKNHTSPQLKSAVTRAYKKYAHALNPKKGTPPVKFFKTTKAQHDTVSRVISSKAMTAKGFFIQVPKGVKPHDYKIKIIKGAILEKIRGRQSDRIVALDSRRMAKNPTRAFREAVAREEKRTGKKAQQAQLIVNGFQGKRVQSIKSMLFYFEHNPRFLDETGELEPDDFDDTFQLKLIYGSKQKRPSRRSTGQSGKKKSRRSR